jgi:hypothetical protein
MDQQAIDRLAAKSDRQMLVNELEVVKAAREHGSQAGVPEDRLEPWLQQLQEA